MTLEVVPSPAVVRRNAYLKAIALSRRRSHDAILTAQLGTVATLLFAGIPHSIALFTMGESASSKSEQLRAFDQPHALLERVDEFTVAGLRPSGHADSSGAKSRPDKHALFVRLKNRVMITSELSGTFRGNPQSLQSRFATMAKWLDGDGYILNTGTFGKQGEAGEFFCVWLGCTTGFKLITWQTMSELGTRLLFFPMEELPKADEVPDGQMKAAANDAREGVRGVLDCMLSQTPMRSLDEAAQPILPPNVYEEIDRLTTLLAVGNAMKSEENSFTARPHPMHYRSRIREIVRGIAWVTGRSEADMTDIRDYVRPIVRRSMPQSRGPILLALYDGCSKITDITAHIRDVQGLKLHASIIAPTLAALKGLGVIHAGPPFFDTGGRPAVPWLLGPEEEDS